MTERYFFFKGRVALYAILKAMGVQQGDEVILPGFTCVVVPNAIQYLGGKPVYVDISMETFNIDARKIEEKITKRTRAIIAQHTFGIPSEMDEIGRIAREYGLFVIEDACHTLGSIYKGKEVGTFGDAAFFSSQWSKPVTTGLGGWAVLHNPDLQKKMEEVIAPFVAPAVKEESLLRFQYQLFSRLLTPSVFWFAQSVYRKLSELGVAVGSSSPDELECRMPDGYAKRMSTWQKDLLERKLDEIGHVITHRRMIAAIYEEMLSARGLETLKLPSQYEPVFLRYPVIVKDKAGILNEARRRRLEIGDWFVSPVHPNLNGWERVGYREGMCPNAEKACKEVVNLPTHEKINPDEARRIINFVSAYVQ